MRNHFGQYFYREGIPVVLAPDDPGSFGYDGVTVDWYAAYISWGLNVGDLKQLALNSLNYSAMNDSEKNNAINNYWRPSWNEYITKMKNLACSRNFTAEALNEYRSVTFSQVLPKNGTAGTKIHIFGRNFEVAICEKPKCKFGDSVVEAVYLSNRHLMCTVPTCPNCNSAGVPVSVALDGTNYEDLKVSFAHEQDPLPSSASHASNMLAVIIFIELYFLY